MLLCQILTQSLALARVGEEDLYLGLSGHSLLGPTGTKLGCGQGLLVEGHPVSSFSHTGLGLGAWVRAVLQGFKLQGYLSIQCPQMTISLQNSTPSQLYTSTSQVFFAAGGRKDGKG